jgi:hypothetical protein
MLKVSKIAFLKEQIFVEGKYRKYFDIFGRECAISQNEIFKMSNYFSLDVGGMEKCFLFQL